MSQESGRSLPLRLALTSLALLVAWLAWKLGAAIPAPIGTAPWSPLLLVVIVFGALTLLQTLWDRCETMLRHRARGKRG